MLQCGFEFAGQDNSVAVPLVEPHERGLPQPLEMADLNRIEDALTNALEPELNGFLGWEITTAGVRESVFYIRDPACAISAVAAARVCCQGHDVQHYVQSDPKWIGRGLAGAAGTRIPLSFPSSRRPFSAALLTITFF